MADTPHAPHGEASEDLQRRNAQGLGPHRKGVIKVRCDNLVQEAHGGNDSEHIDAKVEKRRFCVNIEAFSGEHFHNRSNPGRIVISGRCDV